MNPEARFHSLYSTFPTAAVQAPGRINLIGEHIDYLDGFVMPTAIDRHLTITSALSRPDQHSGEVRVSSTSRSDNAPAAFSLDELVAKAEPSERWLNYIIGVFAGYREAGVELQGMNLLIDSTIPSGSGLSSSAALETAVALTIEAHFPKAAGKLEKCECSILHRARICQKAEHDYAGVPCGIMDQLAVGASRAGHAMLLDCRDQTMEFIELPPGVALVVTDTGVQHALADGEYRKRRQDCEAAQSILEIDSWRDASLSLVESKRELLQDRLWRRARHAVTEMERVSAFARALRHCESEEMGRLMRASHESLRHDFEVSCPELNFLVDAAYAFGPDRGLLGARMTGGGFGGATISLVREENARHLQDHLEQAWLENFEHAHPIKPFITKASGGARILKP